MNRSRVAQGRADVDQDPHLLGRRGVVVSYRTLNRYATTELDFGRRQATVPVADCEPGAEVQIDFGRLGMLTDAADGRRRVVHGLIFTAVYSRHMFVWPTYRQTLADVIAGFEAAWEFFGGVFAVVIPDNMKAIVYLLMPPSPGSTTPSGSTPSPVGSQSIPPGSAARGQPRVERMVSVRAVEFLCRRIFSRLDDCRGRAEDMVSRPPGSVSTAPPAAPGRGLRRRRNTPAQAGTEAVFDIPSWTHPKVAPDRHVQVAKALYSVPGELVGKRIAAGAERRFGETVLAPEVVKVHPVVAPGRRHTDPADLPSEVSVYAMRDHNALQRKAAAHGAHVGTYAAAVLEHPLPWTKMRQVYRLLGMVRRHGADAVKDQAVVPWTPKSSTSGSSWPDFRSWWARESGNL